MERIPIKKKSHNEKVKRTSNPITYPEYEYLSGSEFLVNIIGLNKQFAIVKSLVPENGHNSS